MKNELIDIILTFKLPPTVNNVQLINYFSKFVGSDVKQGSYDVDKLHNTSENKICIHCEQLAEDHSALKKELDCVSKLTFHLEKGTQEQEDLILLLKQFNNSDKRVPITASIDNDLNSTNSPKPESNLAKKSEAIPQKTFSAALKSNRDNTEQKHDKYKENKNSKVGTPNGIPQVKTINTNIDQYLVVTTELNSEQFREQYIYMSHGLELT
ncbi:hypothetical protein JTB14_025295 [Gonioctena quinquepunctata]|nr:hypothetical protein JTB14_025295 [Gonioctena quinquepunctata]